MEWYLVSMGIETTYMKIGKGPTDIIGVTTYIIKKSKKKIKMYIF